MDRSGVAALYQKGSVQDFLDKALFYLWWRLREQAWLFQHLAIAT